MTDSAIIDLYWARREEAIGETRLKYGTYCYTIAHRLLGSPEDAEECVSDTYHAAWNAMPPERPKSLRVWLGRVVRNLSLNRWNREHRQKRDWDHGAPGRAGGLPSFPGDGGNGSGGQGAGTGAGGLAGFPSP